VDCSQLRQAVIFVRSITELIIQAHSHDVFVEMRVHGNGTGDRQREDERKMPPTGAL
jgi:hypothetical protein